MHNANNKNIPLEPGCKFMFVPCQEIYFLKNYQFRLLIDPGGTFFNKGLLKSASQGQISGRYLENLSSSKRGSTGDTWGRQGSNGGGDWGGIHAKFLGVSKKVQNPRFPSSLTQAKMGNPGTSSILH